MKEQEARKDASSSGSREMERRGHLTFIGPAPESLARVLQMSCRQYVSIRVHRGR